MYRYAIEEDVCQMVTVWSLTEALVPVFDRHDVPGPGASGRLHQHLGIEGLADQCARQRRIDADQPLFQIELVRADDPVAGLFAGFVFQGDPGAEVHLARIAWVLANDLELFQPLGEETNSAVDLAQHLLAVSAKEPLIPYYYSLTY